MFVYRTGRKLRCRQRDGLLSRYSLLVVTSNELIINRKGREYKSFCLPSVVLCNFKFEYQASDPLIKIEKQL